MKLLPLSVAGIIVFSTPAYAEKASWFQCEKDADCLNISFSCAGADVNKKFKKEALEFYKRKNATLNCVDSPNSSRNETPFKVYCEKKKCRSVGKNPNIGFS